MTCQRAEGARFGRIARRPRDRRAVRGGAHATARATVAAIAALALSMGAASAQPAGGSDESSGEAERSEASSGAGASAEDRTEEDQPGEGGSGREPRGGSAESGGGAGPDDVDGPSGSLGASGEPSEEGTTGEELPPTANEQYDSELRELEERVVGLKEKVFRSKERLQLLKERILNDVVAQAKLVVLNVNRMGGSLEPVQVHYQLDGEDLKLLDNATGALVGAEPVEIFSGTVSPGNHNLSVEMVYRGASGLFRYLDDYLFKLRANYKFYATKGKITTVRAIGHLKGNITYELTERPSVRFEVDQESYTQGRGDQDDGDGEAGGDEGSTGGGAPRGGAGSRKE